MTFSEAVKAKRGQSFVTTQVSGGQVLMGRIVAQNGHVFKLRTAEGCEVSNLVAEKLSPVHR